MDATVYSIHTAARDGLRNKRKGLKKRIAALTTDFQLLFSEY